MFNTGIILELVQSFLPCSHSNKIYKILFESADFTFKRSSKTQMNGSYKLVGVNQSCLAACVRIRGVHLIPVL